MGQRISRSTVRLATYLVLALATSAALVLPATHAALAGGVAPGLATLDVRGTEQLFAGGPFVPGERREACVTVVYRGGGEPVDVRVAPEVDDRGLGEHLRLQFDEAAPHCASAPEGRTVLAGTLTELDGTITSLFAADESTIRTFEMTVVAGPDLPSGGTTGLDLAWSVTH